MKKEVKIGILAIVALVTVIFGLKFLKGQSVFSSKQTFYSDSSNVKNLTIGTPVYIHGFQVGTVVDMYLKPTNTELVEVEIEVSKDIKVPKSSVLEIVDVGLMGAKAVNLTFESTASGDLAKSGDFLQGRTKGVLTSMLGDPEDLQKYMSQIENGATGILDTINDYFKGVDKSQGVGLAMKNLSATIANLQLLTNQFNLLLQGSNASLQATFANLNGITGNINNKNKEIAALLDNFNNISGQIRDAELDKTIKTANTTFGTANDRMVELKTTLEGANKAIGELSGIMKGVNSGKGTLGKLVNDDGLYLNLERTSKQLDLLMQDLRLNPKRYVNVSVFKKKQKNYNVPESDPAKDILEPKDTMETKNEK